MDLYTDGKIYAQNHSSQIPAQILNPQPHELILDMCASPGSKTSQLAALTHNQAEITALEPDKVRFARLQHNMALLGTTVTCHNYHAERYVNKHLGEGLPLFDRILADVPCSGDGTFCVHDRAGFSHWDANELIKRQKQQLKILKAGLSVLKPGGQLVYSTCSVSPEENEAVIEELLNDSAISSNLSLVDLKPKIHPTLYEKPLASWQGQIFRPEISRCCRILPSYKNEGFFVCLIQKSDLAC